MSKTTYRIEEKENNLIIYSLEDRYDSKEQVLIDFKEDLKKYSYYTVKRAKEVLKEEKYKKYLDKLEESLGHYLDFDNIPKLTSWGNYTVSSSFSDIKRMIADYNDGDNNRLDLNPDFQRDYVWTKTQKIAYVEFVLKGGKTTPLMFNTPNNWQSVVIVDGKQRLSAILDFVDNKFRIFKDLDKEGIGFLWKEIFNHGFMQTKFEITVNELKTRKEVLQWYLDINTGGTKHSKKEIDKVKELIRIEEENESCELPPLK